MARRSLTAIILGLSVAVGIHGEASAQFLDAEGQRFLDGAAVELALGAGTESTDPAWARLGDAIGDRRIVLLGEFTHGAREVAEVRNEVIRFLHHELGFDIVLVEAGIGEQIVPDTRRHALSAEEMTYGLFGAWRTAAFREMMQYIRESDMGLAGYDVQRTGPSFDDILLRQLALASESDPGFASALPRDAGAIESRYNRAQDALRDRAARYDSLKAPTELVIAEYRMLHSALTRPDAARAVDPIVARTVLNRIAFLEYMLQWKADSDWNRRWAARDSMMAANIAWLADEVYPGRKLIVVGHNFHIARHNVNEEVAGEYLLSRFGDDMYAIGFFAGAGSYADNSGEPTAMDPPDLTRRDLKHVIAYVTGDGVAYGAVGATGIALSDSPPPSPSDFSPNVYFLPIPTAGTPGARFLYEDVVVNDTFIDLSRTDHMRLADHFDALVLLSRVSAN